MLSFENLAPMPNEAFKLLRSPFEGKLGPETSECPRSNLTHLKGNADHFEVIKVGIGWEGKRGRERERERETCGLTNYFLPYSAVFGPGGY